ncbi:hypothetical protein RhiirA4_484508, partial [Rhizophagus irregularis]
ISHAIKRYVQIGYDIKGGQDIVEAGKNLAGTYFANTIEPNRNENNKNSGQMNNNTRKKKKPKPTEGLLAGFIQARSLPHIGSWSQFSPAVISDLCDDPIVQSQPTLSIYTQVTSTWTMPMPQLNVDVSDDIIDITNQPNNQSDTENNSSNINRNPNWQHPTAKRRFSVAKGVSAKAEPNFWRKGKWKKNDKEEMHDELLKYVETEEIEEQDIPKVSTIQGWISRYAVALKYQATEAALLKYIIVPKFDINSLNLYVIKKNYEKKR